MLRVGLTGGLGSGKSAVARMLAAHGAHVLSSDEIGRELMQPSQPVFRQLLTHFGIEILADDGTLNRAALARLAFGGEGKEVSRVEELNAIIHPAVIAHQAELVAQIAARDPHAIVVVESALLFETTHGGPDGWQSRFDRIVLVRASDDLKIARFVERTFGKSVPAEPAAEVHGEALRRLGLQRDDDWKAARSNFILTNNGSLEELQSQVDALWPTLLTAAQT